MTTKQLFSCLFADSEVSNGNSLEDKPEFKKLLSHSPPSEVPAGDAPEPEELIKAIQELENSASSDAIVREKIARLPPEVSEIGHLEKLQSAREGEQLMKKVLNRKYPKNVSKYSLTFFPLSDQGSDGITQ